MSNSIKKLLALTLSVLFLLTFAACGNTDTNGSAIPNDKTQDYEEESFWEDEYTDEEKEQIEDLWNDGIVGGQITSTPSNTESSNISGSSSSDSKTSQSGGSTTPSSSVSNSSTVESSASSSEVSNSNNSVSSEATSSEVSSEESSSENELAPEIPSSKPNGIF